MFYLSLLMLGFLVVLYFVTKLSKHTSDIKNFLFQLTAGVSIILFFGLSMLFIAGQIASIHHFGLGFLLTIVFVSFLQTKINHSPNVKYTEGREYVKKSKKDELLDLPGIKKTSWVPKTFISGFLSLF